MKKLMSDINQVILETVKSGSGYGPVFARLCEVISSSQIKGRSKFCY
jgi:hypothetical protein